MFVVDRLPLELDALDLVVARVSLLPGEAVTSELGRGPALVVVERGSLTWYATDDYEARTFTSGEAWTQADPGEGLLRNDGSIVATALVTFVSSRRQPDAVPSPSRR